MSSVAIVDRAREHTDFFSTYYSDAVAQLAERYPSEQSWLRIDWGNLYAYDPDLADEYLTHPDEVGVELQWALVEYNPLPVDFTDGENTPDVDIRMVGLNEGDIYSPLEVTRDVADRDEEYVGVRGDLAKVTEPKPEVQEAAFRCRKCGTIRYVTQTSEKFAEPDRCGGCEGKPSFEPVPDESEFKPHAKVRVETPPDERGALQTEYIDGDARGPIVWSGGEDFGLAERTGDSVVVYGTVTKSQVFDGRTPTRFFENVFEVQAVEFDDDADDVNIEEHRERFETLAADEGAVDTFAESLVPELHPTPEWETALQLLVAYLFGAPRIDVEDGPTIRGDIHVLIVSDFGMGKSMTNAAVANYSPNSIKEAVTGMSSDVSLLAAAVEDDFGQGGWTLKPGILVRANGGHVILDEIDKTDADLERMNNALEGEQVVDVDKAGQQATFKSRVGLLATGNPIDSRFDSMAPVADQIGIDRSLLSRFDGIVTMSDQAEAEQDRDIAEQIGTTIAEAAEYEYGGRDELDALAREVPPDVGRAWIAHARDEIRPQVDMDHVEDVARWYAEEVRPLNKTFAEDNTEGADMPVPASPRVVSATLRFAMAFARANLRETVTDADIERAKTLQRTLIGQTFDEESGTFTPREIERSTPSSQEERKDALTDTIERLSDGDAVAYDDITTEMMNTHGVPPGKTEDELEALLTRGELYEPKTDHYLTT